PFVGGHPIAGGEEAGAAAAERGLFAGRECIVTPGASATAAAVDKVRRLWERLGMRVAIMDAERHDQVLAWVSHLPHAISFALMRSLAAADPSMAQHGGQSWHDLTRIAASSPEMWRDVFRTNAGAAAEAIDQFVASLRDLRALIAAGDQAALFAWLEQARAAKRATDRDRAAGGTR
ncbi:MAG TPA: prephenate dehydrogenase/arogenate dehydrogenase family protein, partial [Terriglobales bacterium]|nr:prephenate dehydrogenase/arogenate dehydrogenase family protein [Terriglobales bacterium]